MPSIWTNFIKEFSAKHNLKYACALSKYKEPLKKAYKLFKEKKEWYEPLTNEVGVGGANKWTNFVKEYATKNNTTYGCALSDIGIKNAYKLFKDGKTWYFPKTSAVVETQTDEFIEPVPVKTPENIEPVVNRIEEKVKKLESLGSKNGAVSYEGSGFMGTIAFVNLLKKYGGQCVVANIIKDKGIYLGENIGINLNSNPKLSMIRLEPNYDRLGKSLRDCINRGVKVICIPLVLHFGKGHSGHANMLVYRPFKRLVERFEPHGQAYGNSEVDNKAFNTQLKQLWEKDLIPYIGPVKFREPQEICPDSRGFQSLEGQLQKLKSEGGGFCIMWSFFLAEMTFINPDKSTKEIIDEVFDITKKDPAYLRSVIRGYVIEIEQELDKLLKIMGKSGFSFKQKTLKSIQAYDFEKWLLSTVFDSSKYSEAPPNFEPLPDTVLNSKSDIDKLKETYYNKIKSLTKINFDLIYELYGLYPPKIRVADKSYHLINHLYDGTFAKYGASGLNDIDVILEEELHKGKGAFKQGLAREGYFIKKQEEREKAPKEEPKEVPKEEPKEEPKKPKKAPKKAPKKELTDQKINDETLINNWEDTNLGILLSQLKPQAYLNMEKKINELTDKKQYIVLGILSFFIKDILDKLFLKYGGNMTAINIILYGLAEITEHINDRAEYNMEDYTTIYKYLSQKNKEKLRNSQGYNL